MPFEGVSVRGPSPSFHFQDSLGFEESVVGLLHSK